MGKIANDSPQFEVTVMIALVDVAKICLLMSSVGRDCILRVVTLHV